MTKVFEMWQTGTNGAKTTFTEKGAPDWLTGRKSVKGSTMDSRWFWDNYILKLKIDQQIETDFNTIKRIE